jgi:ubiquitin-conjugating enzyme E2 M
MIKLFGVGRGRGAGSEGASGSSAAPGEKTVSNGVKIHPGQLRMQTELSELELPISCKIEFPDSNDLMKFNVHIRPDDGFWRDARYKFTFLIKPLYPHDPPKVKCETPIYHPNIDLEGNVCLNILREDWKPILCISAVVYGLIHLLLEPNPNDPLNQEAAELLRNNRPEFARTVARTLRGGFHCGVEFPKLI